MLIFLFCLSCIKSRTSLEIRSLTFLLFFVQITSLYLNLLFTFKIAAGVGPSTLASMVLYSPSSADISFSRSLEAAESEANFAVVSRLSRKIDECSAGYVLVCESSDEKIANAVISATKNKNAKILSLDSMQSAVIGDAGYIEMAERNLEVLKTALG